MYSSYPHMEYDGDMDVLETAFVNAEVRQALRRSQSLSRRVREHLYDCLKSCCRLDVVRDSIFRVAIRLAFMLRVLQNTTGLPLVWHQRPLSFCYSAGVIDPGVTRPALGRFYFRMAVDGQGMACACARYGISDVRRHGCFCDW